MILKNLCAQTIPLTGKHLIEASAGTGKTYNITRIYLRLLLERELTVEQILLVTFTKDATQELRGRIDSFLREALSNWSHLCDNDEYFATIKQHVDNDRVVFLLKRALLHLDEASIFTIHGFCQRVLTQHAFASGLPFNASLAKDNSDIVIQGCQDWYRHLAKHEQEFSLVAEFWPTPQSFLSSFAKAISHTSTIAIQDVYDIQVAFARLLKQASDDLAQHADLLHACLIDVKKGSAREERVAELTELTVWLKQLYQATESNDFLNQITPMPDKFIDGRRFSRAKEKFALQSALLQVNEVKSQVKTIGKKIAKAKAYAIVQQGIYLIRQKVIDRKQQLNLLDFDDLINTLATKLQQQDTKSGLLAAQLFKQYPVALVDEFQDTDPKQFAILKAIYFSDASKDITPALYLIGDPKQAIYGFRGGDIFAYLNARKSCQYHWLMDTNWRSTKELVNGYNQLFVSKNEHSDLVQDDSVFGFNIPYLPVKAGKEQQGNIDFGTKSNSAIQFIHFNCDDGKVAQNARTILATWCANEIIQLITSQQVKPKDIAILVRDGAEARDIKQALQLAALDSVFLSDRSNLFQSKQAEQIYALLMAILQVENDAVFIAGLCSGLLGLDAEKLYSLQQDEQAYQQLKYAFVDYRKQWQHQGFIAMAINLMQQHFDLANEDKDRALTNALHLFEILQSASQRFHQAEELLHWLARQISLDNPEAEAELRLESDGDLIRIVTQHGSKGLEYPVVFIPFVTRHKDPLKFGNKSVSYIEYHDASGQLQLSLDGSNDAKQAMSDEAYAETIRLLYVAVTRAEKRCYLLTCAFDSYHLSPLGKTLAWQKDQNIVASLTQLQQLDNTNIAVEQNALDDIQALVMDSNFAISQRDSVKGSSAKVSQFTGHIERDWWLSSFSALSRNMKHVGISMPDRDNQALGREVESNQHLSELRFELTKGASSGNLIHDILEHVDFQKPNWREATHWPLTKYGELPNSFTVQDLTNWLDEVLNCRFIASEGNLLDNDVTAASLADVPTAMTLRESEFYFPMHSAKAGRLAKLLTDHRNNAKLADTTKKKRRVIPVQLPNYQTLSGMMHGFIDLIFSHQGKYYVSDYKSSFLGASIEDYHHDMLLNHVEANHYDLQYLIYALALHRHLKHALPNYDFNRDFGGVYYLYVRGMSSHACYNGCGVYYRQISLTEILTLDALFSGDKHVGNNKETVKETNHD